VLVYLDTIKSSVGEGQAFPKCR